MTEILVGAPRNFERFKSGCQRFSPNVFTPSKCQECFRQKCHHSAEALAENRMCRKVCKCGFLFVAPTDLDFTNPAHRSRRWQRRWFILYDDGELTYSLDENVDTLPQAVIDMTEVVEVTNAESFTGHDFSIAVKSPHAENYLKGVNKEEIKWWYDVLAMYPRSRRFSKQQRSQNQKLRSRTLPNNALSDDQLAALKILSSREDYSTSKTVIMPPLKHVAPSFPVSSETSTISATSPAAFSSSTGNLQNQLPLENRLSTVEQVKEPTLAKSNSVAPNHNSLTCLTDKDRKTTSVEPNNGNHNYNWKITSEPKADALERKGLVLEATTPNRLFYRTTSAPENHHESQTDDALGSTTDNLTDSDSSSNSEDVYSVKKLRQTSRKPSTQTAQRFVFTGLSSKDIQDLKQLQRIMNKKDPTGSTSSRSSSTSSAYGVPKQPRKEMTVLPRNGLDKFDHPKSPPISRTIISRAKERSRVRSRSPKPDKTASLQEMIPAIDGNNEFEKMVSKSDGRKYQEIGAPQNWQTGRMLSMDQSTQISLDVRHYETMVSNLEKRLLDREQLVRELSHKLDDSEKAYNREVAEKEKVIDMSQKQLEKNRKDSKMLISNLEMSTSLNHKYEKRLQSLLEKASQKDVMEEKSQQQASRIQDLEKQLSDMNISYNDMINRRDDLLSSSRRDVERLTKKLNDTESLLLMALNEKDTHAAGVPEESHATKNDDSINQLATKFLNSLKEIRHLSQEKSLLESQFAELNAKSDHTECHLTNDALHAEINSLQARLQNQEKKQAENAAQKSEVMKKFADELESLKRNENIALELKSVKAAFQRKVEQLEKTVSDLKSRHEMEIEQLREQKDKELAEEAKATKYALEIIQRAHQDQMSRELARMAEIYSRNGETVSDLPMDSPVFQNSDDQVASASNYSSSEDKTNDSALGPDQKIADISERYKKMISEMMENHNDVV